MIELACFQIELPNVCIMDYILNIFCSLKFFHKSKILKVYDIQEKTTQRVPNISLPMTSKEQNQNEVCIFGYLEQFYCSLFCLT